MTAARFLTPHSAGCAKLGNRGWRRIGRGFTLLELVFSIAILIFIAVLAVGNLKKFRQSSEIDRVVNDTLGLLREARSKTLGSENDSVYGVHFSPAAVTLFQGGIYNPASASNIVVVLPSNVSISVIDLSTTTDNVIFERLTGESKAIGTVTYIINGSASVNRKVQILPSGLFLKQ